MLQRRVIWETAIHYESMKPTRVLPLVVALTGLFSFSAFSAEVKLPFGERPRPLSEEGNHFTAR